MSYESAAVELLFLLTGYTNRPPFPAARPPDIPNEVWNEEL
jgi:hypothetical protein